MQEKLKSGDALRKIKAATLNRMIDASEEFAQRRALGTPRGLQPVAPTPDIIKVKNVTGGDLARGRIVKVGPKLIDPLDPEHLWFEGQIPTGSCGPLAILRRPIPDGQIDEAQVSGAALARVQVLATSHRFAYPTDGQTLLTSGLAGPCQLFGQVTATGEQDLAVVIQNVASGRRLAKLNGSLAQGGTATAAEIIWTGSAWEYSGITFTVADFFLNEGESVPAGTKIWAEWFCNVWVPLPYCLPSNTLPEA